MVLPCRNQPVFHGHATNRSLAAPPTAARKGGMGLYASSGRLGGQSMNASPPRSVLVWWWS